MRNARARARAMPPRVAQARFETFKPGVDELEAEIAEKKRWLVQLDSPGGEKEVRVTSRQIPLIIGRGGATIRQLQLETEVEGARAAVKAIQTLRSGRLDVQPLQSYLRGSF